MVERNSDYQRRIRDYFRGDLGVNAPDFQTDKEAYQFATDLYEQKVGRLVETKVVRCSGSYVLGKKDFEGADALISIFSNGKRTCSIAERTGPYGGKCSTCPATR